MTPVAWMAGASMVSWLVASRVMGDDANPEVLYGMLAPLLVVVVSWVVVERTYRANPERLMRVMVEGLALKALFFGAYVVGMLRLVEVRPVPFVVSFTSYFIALHVTEAVLLRRLFKF